MAHFFSQTTFEHITLSIALLSIFAVSTVLVFSLQPNIAQQPSVAGLSDTSFSVSSLQVSPTQTQDFIVYQKSDSELEIIVKSLDKDVLTIPVGSVQLAPHIGGTRIVPTVRGSVQDAVSVTLAVGIPDYGIVQEIMNVQSVPLAPLPTGEHEMSVRIFSDYTIRYPFSISLQLAT